MSDTNASQESLPMTFDTDVPGSVNLYPELTSTLRLGSIPMPETKGVDKVDG